MSKEKIETVYARSELTEYQYEAFLNRDTEMGHRVANINLHLSNQADDREEFNKGVWTYWRITNWCLVIIAICQLFAHWEAIFKGVGTLILLFLSGGS